MVYTDTVSGKDLTFSVDKMPVHTDDGFAEVDGINIYIKGSVVLRVGSMVNLKSIIYHLQKVAEEIDEEYDLVERE